MVRARIYLYLPLPRYRVRGQSGTSAPSDTLPAQTFVACTLLRPSGPASIRSVGPRSTYRPVARAIVSMVVPQTGRRKSNEEECSAMPDTQQGKPPDGLKQLNLGALAQFAYVEEFLFSQGWSAEIVAEFVTDMKALAVEGRGRGGAQGTSCRARTTRGRRAGLPISMPLPSPRARAYVRAATASALAAVSTPRRAPRGRASHGRRRGHRRPTRTSASSETPPGEPEPPARAACSRRCPHCGHALLRLADGRWCCPNGTCTEWSS